MKACRSCDRQLPETEFHRSAASRDGLATKCKQCARAAARLYYAAHREENVARARAWQIANPERVRETRRRTHQSPRAKSYMEKYRRRHASERRERDLAQIRSCPYCAAEMTHREWLNHRKGCEKRPLSRHAVYRKGHPLGQGQHDRVATHRFVLYEKIGPGSHPCHWCDSPVTWTKGGRGPGCPKGALAVDHLDGDSTNNAPENLVPACTACNTLRALVANWEARTGRAVFDLL